MADFSSFMLGIPYIRSPPIRSCRSNTVTLWPLRFRRSAAARPAGPLPITATVFRSGFSEDSAQQGHTRSRVNRSLIFLLSHRICIHIAGAGRLTQCRTYPGGKLRETVRLLKPFVGLPVLLVVYQIIEFRNQIILTGTRKPSRSDFLRTGRTARRRPCISRPALSALQEGAVREIHGNQQSALSEPFFPGLPFIF